MQKRKFRPGDKCIIVELGQGAFHFEVRENFKGKRVVFVEYCNSKFIGKGFIACMLRLEEDICTDKKAREYMREYILKGSTFFFPCVKLTKAT